MLTKGFTVCISPLSLLETKEKGVIINLKNKDEKVIEKITSMGLMPGVEVTLERRFISLVIKVGETRLTIDKKIADSIYVRVAEK